jgi:hypothetical protein
MWIAHASSSAAAAASLAPPDAVHHAVDGPVHVDGGRTGVREVGSGGLCGLGTVFAHRLRECVCRFAAHAHRHDRGLERAVWRYSMVCGSSV